MWGDSGDLPQGQNERKWCTWSFPSSGHCFEHPALCHFPRVVTRRSRRQLGLSMIKAAWIEKEDTHENELTQLGMK